MKKRTWMHLGMMIAIMSLSACGKENEVSNQVTEQLDVEDGIVFQTMENEVLNETEQDLSELILTAENIEGMRERSIALKKYAKIYAKPSAESAVIGEGGRGEVLTVYENSENGEWYSVSYNGRIGYVKEDCIKEDVSEHKNSLQNENIRPDNENHSDGNADSSNNQTQNSGGSDNSQETDNSQNNSETQVPSGTDNSENDSETQPPSGTDNSEDDSETQPPGETDNLENDSEIQLPSGTDNSEDDSETQLPSGTDNSENDSETQPPSGTDNSENDSETQLPSETDNSENNSETQVPSGTENAENNETQPLSEIHTLEDDNTDNKT